MHMSIPLDDGLPIGNDFPPNYFRPIRSVCLDLTLDSIESAHDIWNVLAESRSGNMNGNVMSYWGFCKAAAGSEANCSCVEPM